MLNSVKTANYDPRQLIRYPDDTEVMSPSEYSKLKDFMALYRVILTPPMVWRVRADEGFQPTGQVMVLAGWWVCQAAIEIGRPYVHCTVIDDYLTPQQRAHLHLAMISESHLVDKSKVRGLYSSLRDPNMKATSGYDDKKLGLDVKPELGKVRRPGIKYQTFALTFLPSEADAMLDALERAMGETKAKATMIADYADYDRFMRAVEIAQKKGDAVDIADALKYILDVFMRCENVDKRV